MNIPIELAKARKTAETAWSLYNQIVDDGATQSEKDNALATARTCDEQSRQWYERWQKVGGTSDIESIEKAELASAYTLHTHKVFSGTDYPLTLEQLTSAQHGQAGEELGTRFILSAGDPAGIERRHIYARMVR